MIVLDPDLDPDPAPVSATMSAASGTAQESRIDKMPSARVLARFLIEAQAAVRLRGEVTVLLTTDAASAKLNRRFRGKNKATDVLSFPAGPMPGAAIAGDLAISVPTAARQAVEQGHSLSIEIKVLMLHGLLHLAGYDHEVDDGKMARRERLLRDRLGLPQGLIERATPEAPALKGRGFSRVARSPKETPALAAEEPQAVNRKSPQGLKPRNSMGHGSARLKPSPFKADERRGAKP